MFLICSLSISTLVIAVFFYASLSVPGHTSAGFQALGFSGDFSAQVPSQMQHVLFW